MVYFPPISLIFGFCAPLTLLAWKNNYYNAQYWVFLVQHIVLNSKSQCNYDNRVNLQDFFSAKSCKKVFLKRWPVLLTSFSFLIKSFWFCKNVTSVAPLYLCEFVFRFEGLASLCFMETKVCHCFYYFESMGHSLFIMESK